MTTLRSSAQVLVLFLIAIQVIFNIYSSNLFIRRLHEHGESPSKDKVSITASVAGVANDAKILAFADAHYVALAKVWYERLSSLGYNQHYIVCVDDKAYKKLSQENYRLIQRYISNPDYEGKLDGDMEGERLGSSEGGNEGDNEGVGVTLVTSLYV